jgi:hypothetical protein
MHKGLFPEPLRIHKKPVAAVSVFLLRLNDLVMLAKAITDSACVFVF